MKHHSASNHRTSSELKKLKRKFKKAGLLADTTKVSGATISRILSGKTRPSQRTLAKLVEVLDTKTAAQFFAAYFSDQIPRSLRKELQVSLRGKDSNPFVLKILSLDDKYIAHLEPIVDALLNQQSGPNKPTAILPHGNWPQSPESY
jgi:transcriptional regulator with XRE-family HTH domain